MTIKVSVPNDPTDLKARIVVFGVGGAGGNAVNNMIRYNLEGVDCVVANTDAQALAQSLAERRVQLGRNITQGLGAGSRPDIGRAAAEEGMDEIREQLQGTHMAFITAGMGGGTGTGASPVIAKAAREEGILTVGVVTKPFHFEGERRMEVAETGLAELEQFVDTLIVIPNQNLFRVANENTTFADAFKMADDVLYAGVRGVTDLMVMPGLINLDFADIRTVMSEMGKAMMGAGEAEGADRAKEAAEAAISNPLLDDISMKGAHGVLINITGGQDMKLFEVDEAVNRIRDEVDAGANIIFGSTFDETLDGRMRVSIFATGIDAEPVAAPKPIKIQLVAKDGSRTAMPAAEPEPEPERVPGAAAATAAADSGHEVPREPQKGPEQMAPPREPAPRAPVPPTPAAIQAAARERVAAPPRPRPDADRAVPQERDAPARQPGDAVARPAPDVERRHPAARPADVAKPAPEAPAVAPEPRHPGLFGSVDDDPATSQASGSRADVVTTLEDHEPIASSQDDEALLEIPAFLRRQAN